MTPNDVASRLDPSVPVLIAGPTASGKSALALDIAERQGGVIINADALQVFENWPILSARPSQDDTERAKHALYGHVAYDATYSVGHWLRQVAPYLTGSDRPIIVGGTGLYFMALTQGLAEIPPTPTEIRSEADDVMRRHGRQAMLSELDNETQARIDTLNPMRVQRAWEVLKTTGRSLVEWQDATPPPLLPINAAQAFLLEADKAWLNNRITQRFDLMLEAGALDEAHQNHHRWDPSHLSAKTIGAPELIAYIEGQMTLAAAQEASVIATRQFAKRQRTWFRSKMSDWTKISIG